jgi:hypothetical protein
MVFSIFVFENIEINAYIMYCIYEHHLIFKLWVIYCTKGKWFVTVYINIVSYHNTPSMASLQIKFSDLFAYTVLHISRFLIPCGGNNIFVTCHVNVSVKE